MNEMNEMNEMKEGMKDERTNPKEGSNEGRKE